MKVNAPEDIYLLPDERNSNSLSICWYEAPYRTGAIKYIRTDAFIEKACEKLEKCMYDNLMFQGRLHRKEVIETFIEDFKKSMED